jgi:thiol:disulfide interchange protein
MNATRRNALVRAVAILALTLPLATIAADPLYPDVSRAFGDVTAAFKQAAAEKKRVIVDFGGNWCADCKVLDINLKKAENAEVLKKHYVLVHVNVGDKGITDNFDLAEQFGIPLKKGVPALAVLEANGKLVYAQRDGEFESMRKLDPKSVNEFLQRWSR